MNDQLVVPDVRALADAMARIAQQRPDLDGFAEAMAASQASLADAIDAGTAQLVKIIHGKQHRTVLRYPELALAAGDPRLWALIGMLRELGNRSPVVLDLGDGAAEPKWLRYLHPRIQLAGPPSTKAALGDSRPRVPRDRLAEGLAYQILISNDPTYRLPAAAVHLHDARWSPDPAPVHATHVLDADGVVLDSAGNPVLDGFPWWSSSMNWDPILPKRNSPNGEPWIAIATPHAGSPGIGTLVSAAAHAAACPVRCFEVGAHALPSELLALLRVDPPSLVIEFNWPASASTIREWCGFASIPYVATLSAAETLRAVAFLPPAAIPPEPAVWGDVLNNLYPMT